MNRFSGFNSLGQLQYFEVPTGAFPIPWNMQCLPGQVKTADGECRNRRAVSGKLGPKRKSR